MPASTAPAVKQGTELIREQIAQSLRSASIKAALISGSGRAIPVACNRFGATFSAIRGADVGGR